MLFWATALIYAIGILPIIVYLHGYDPVEHVPTDSSGLSVARVRDTLRETGRIWSTAGRQLRM